MSISKDRFEDALKNISQNKPATIFLTSKSCNGKSYFSNMLKDKGYKILELDLIVRKLASKHKIGTAPNYDPAFKIYKDNLTPEFRKEFIQIIRNFIKANKYSLIEGAISSVELINDIFKNISYTFIYLYPWFVKDYADRITKRLKIDIENNTRTVPFWNEVPVNVNKLLLKKQFDNDIVQKFINKMATQMKKDTIKRYKYFLSKNCKIYTVIV